MRFFDCVSKFILFYQAPITSFWIWSLSFGIFMLLFIYILLIEFTPNVNWIEYFIAAYVAALGMEHFRKVFFLNINNWLILKKIF